MPYKLFSLVSLSDLARIAPSVTEYKMLENFGEQKLLPHPYLLEIPREIYLDKRKKKK